MSLASATPREPASREGTAGRKRVTASGRKDGDFVQSLDRGLAVIRAFGPDNARLTLSEVSRATGLTRAAARRFLLTLVHLGYVSSNGREYSLRPRVLELGYAYLSSIGLPELAQPHLEELVGKVHESSSMAVLDGDDVVDILRVRAKAIMTVSVPIGTHFPAYASSKGRVLLVDLPDEELDRYLGSLRFDRLTSRTVPGPARLRGILDEVRAQGYAIADQELEDGLRSVAVSVHDAKGTAIAAINISAYANRVSVERMRKELVPLLRYAADQIEADLRGQGDRGRPTTVGP
jgi:IclR family pca regulon transcriptional regulator